MRDFTLKVYKELLSAIKNSRYSLQTYEDYLVKPKTKVLILRHDSDIWPINDLRMAKIESNLNIAASYYFRIPYTFDINIIKEISSFGHEIGYHYEDLVVAKGDFQIAIKLFKKNLGQLRRISSVKTIAMHGRPLSKFDSRDLWRKYRLADFGIFGETHINVDYNKVLYLTDTGSRWDGDHISIRDNVQSRYNFKIKSTFQLIDNIKQNNLPDQIMINAHPARWNDNLKIWFYRYLLQHAKNIAKRYLKLMIRHEPKVYKIK